VKRILAEVFPPGEFIRDELEARGLTEYGFEALLVSVGCTPAQVCACLLAAYVDDKSQILDADTASSLSKAFGTSQGFWMKLDRAWRGSDK
jgi:HTH-type transcriptional regulator/antitoxin HigA